MKIFQFPVSGFQFPQIFEPANEWDFWGFLDFNLLFSVSTKFAEKAQTEVQTSETQIETHFSYHVSRKTFQIAFCWNFVSFRFSVSSFQISVSMTQRMRFFQFPVSSFLKFWSQPTNGHEIPTGDAPDMSQKFINAQKILNTSFSNVALKEKKVSWSYLPHS